MKNKFEGMRSTSAISNVTNQLVTGLLEKQETLILQVRDLYCANEGISAERTKLVMNKTVHGVSVYSLAHGDKLVPLIEIYPPTYGTETPDHSYRCTANVKYELLYR